jgi:UDP-glucuronate decarboxylase
MYDEAKRYGEALIYAYRERYGLDTVIARFFNTYGPRMDPEDGRVVTNLIVQALGDQPMTVYGKGDQTRSFCYIDDLVLGIVKLIDSDLEGPVNLGNPHEFSVLELAKKILAKTGSSSKIIYLPLPGDDPTQRQPDITLAKEKLNWQPTIELDEGLEKTILYFQTKLK